jgi:hypothetical protein
LVNKTNGKQKERKKEKRKEETAYPSLFGEANSVDPSSVVLVVVVVVVVPE